MRGHEILVSSYFNLYINPDSSYDANLRARIQTGIKPSFDFDSHNRAVFYASEQLNFNIG